MKLSLEDFAPLADDTKFHWQATIKSLDLVLDTIEHRVFTLCDTTVLQVSHSSPPGGGGLCIYGRLYIVINDDVSRLSCYVLRATSCKGKK